MVAIAICIADPALRDNIETRLRARADLTITVADADTLAAVLAIQDIDAVLLDWPANQVILKALEHEAAAPVALVADGDEDAVVDALQAGATAVLSRDADAADITATAAAVVRGLSILPRLTLDRLLNKPLPLVGNDGNRPLLTPREIEVLTAMADGASNKMIARRLGISFHTVKFHVAAILAKLDAETRTEAVANAARLGLVML